MSMSLSVLISRLSFVTLILYSLSGGVLCQNTLLSVPLTVDGNVISMDLLSSDSSVLEAVVRTINTYGLGQAMVGDQPSEMASQLAGIMVDRINETNESAKRVAEEELQAREAAAARTAAAGAATAAAKPEFRFFLRAEDMSWVSLYSLV